LLRVLSDGHFYRVGGHQPLKANVRVIAATHQNLEQRAKEGAFREDLFHRLNVIRLRLPPLRERTEDIPTLTRHFLAKSAKELGVEPKRISEEALQALMAFDFPGNVRQLENLCHWLTVMAPAQSIAVKDLPPEIQDKGNAPGAAHAAPETAKPVAAGTPPAPIAAAGAEAAAAQPAGWLAEFEREAHRLLAAGEPQVWDHLMRQFETSLIRAALDSTRGRRIEAAVKLGIGRNTITRKIEDLGLGKKP
jgi:two-component system nitrogen regulation response regulator GlnG